MKSLVIISMFLKFPALVAVFLNYYILPAVVGHETYGAYIARFSAVWLIHSFYEILCLARPGKNLFKQTKLSAYFLIGIVLYYCCREILLGGGLISLVLDLVLAAIVIRYAEVSSIFLKSNRITPLIVAQFAGCIVWCLAIYHSARQDSEWLSIEGAYILYIFSAFCILWLSFMHFKGALLQSVINDAGHDSVDCLITRFPLLSMSAVPIFVLGISDVEFSQLAVDRMLIGGAAVMATSIPLNSNYILANKAPNLFFSPMTAWTIIVIIAIIALPLSRILVLLLSINPTDIKAYMVCLSAFFLFLSSTGLSFRVSKGPFGAKKRIVVTSISLFMPAAIWLSPGHYESIMLMTGVVLFAFSNTLFRLRKL